MPNLDDVSRSTGQDAPECHGQLLLWDGLAAPNCALDELAQAAVRAKVINPDSVQMADIAPGVKFGCYHADNVTFAFWEFPSGLILDRHSHPQEQVTTVISGKVRITAGLETYLLSEGMSMIIPPGVEHEAQIIETVRIHDVFSPRREEFDDLKSIRDKLAGRMRFAADSAS